HRPQDAGRHGHRGKRPPEAAGGPDPLRARLGADAQHHVGAQPLGRGGRGLVAQAGGDVVLVSAHAVSVSVRSASARRARARCRRDLTVPAGRSSAIAASSIDMPTTSHATATTRNSGSSADSASSRSSRASTGESTLVAGTSSTGSAVRPRRSSTSYVLRTTIRYIQVEKRALKRK